MRNFVGKTFQKTVGNTRELLYIDLWSELCPATL